MTDITPKQFKSADYLTAAGAQEVFEYLLNTADAIAHTGSPDFEGSPVLVRRLQRLAAIASFPGVGFETYTLRVQNVPVRPSNDGTDEGKEGFPLYLNGANGRHVVATFTL